jgi:hypothetical protein
MQKLIETVKAPTWEEISSILRSDKRRGYKVDIETDATNAMDSETEKAQRIEFITAMGTMLAESLPMIAQAPPPAAAALVTLLKENAMFAAGAFKAGRTMEEAYDDAFTKLEEQAKAQASQPPKPSPEEQKMQADMMAKQADLQFQQQSKQMEFQFREKEAQQAAQIEQQRFAHESKIKEQELQHTMQLETFKAQSEAQLRQYTAEQEMQFRAHEFEANQVMNSQKMAADAQNMQQQSAMKQQQSDRDFAMQDRQQGMAEVGAMRKEGFEREKFDRQMQAEAMQAHPAEGGGGAVQAQLAQLNEQVAQLAQMLASLMGGGQQMMTQGAPA